MNGRMGWSRIQNILQCDQQILEIRGIGCVRSGGFNVNTLSLVMTPHTVLKKTTSLIRNSLHHQSPY